MVEKKQAPKKRVKKKVSRNKKALNQADALEQRIVIIEETEYFTFTNRRKGPLFFKREDGKEDMFEGHSTKDDISDRERVLLMNSKDFKNGWLVQEFESGEVTEESVHNKNTLSDERLKSFVDKNINNTKVFKNFISEMSSEFAINRLKEILVSDDAPNSLVAFCDYQLEKIKESFLESMKAPIDKAEKELKNK